MTREITAAEKRRGRRLDLVQNAVDPVAHGQTVLERLDMDVGSACLERVGDDERDEADHGRLGGEILQLLDVGVEREVVAALLDIADDLPDRRAAGAVETLERGVELSGYRHQRLHVAAGDHAEGADRVGVGRIGHRQRQLVFVLAHRERPRFAQEASGNALLEDREFRIAGGVHEREVELCRERLGDVALRADTERHQQRAQPLAAVLLDAKCALEARSIQFSACDQDLAEPFANRCVHAWNRSRIGKWSR